MLTLNAVTVETVGCLQGGMAGVNTHALKSQGLKDTEDKMCDCLIPLVVTCCTVWSWPLATANQSNGTDT